MKAHSAINGITKLTFAELLHCEFRDLIAAAKGQLLFGVKNGPLPSLHDDAILVDYDVYAENDLTELEYEGCQYLISLDGNVVDDVLRYHKDNFGDDTLNAKLRSLIYYIAFDAFHTGSDACNDNWSSLVGDHSTKG